MESVGGESLQKLESVFDDGEESLKKLCGEDYDHLAQKGYSPERLWTASGREIARLFPGNVELYTSIYEQFNLDARRTRIENAVNRRETQDTNLLQWLNKRLEHSEASSSLSSEASSVAAWLRRLQQDLKRKSANPVVYAESVAVVLVEAWGRRFEDPLGVVDYLLGELEENVREWSHNTSYHAAWTVLLQSSGWGKSRTVCELHTRGVHVVYLSFMTRGSSGYPRESPVCSLVSGGDGSDPRFVAAWIFSILHELVVTTPTEWMEMQMGEESARELAGRVGKRYAVLREDVANVRQQIPREGEEWDKTQLQKWVETTTDKLSLDKMKVLIHLDEAATFFKCVPGSFLATRRFFSCIKRGSWIFGLVSDTAGKLGLVFPEKMYDPSARAKRSETNFFKAVWVVGTLWGNGQQLIHLMNSHQAHDLTIPPLEVTRELFKWGRPLWRSVVEGAGSGGAANLDDVVGFAIQKLLGGNALTTLEQNEALMTHGMATAILGVAAGLDVGAWSDLARDMVANHMRTVSYIAGERDMVYSADALEPILGEAAARILKNHLQQVLKVVEGVLKQGYVIEGARGEIVGRLVMVLAMHDLCRETSNGCNIYSHPVKLQDFLTKLCGEHVEAKGLVCFNRFIMLDRREITREHLLICFICCVAIIPQRGQEVFDALLAVLLPGPDGKYEVRADRMVGVPVQLKNRISTSLDVKSLAEWARKFYFEEVGSDVKDPRKGDENDIASSDSKDPKKMSVVVGEDEDDEDGGDSADDEEDDDAKDPGYSESADNAKDPDYSRKSKRPRIGELTNLDLPLGIYMHLGGRKKFTDEHDHELDNQNEKVLIFRGLKYPFLKVADQMSLQQLRSAFFKLDDHLKGKQGMIVRHNLSNYFKPMDLGPKSRLTLTDLQRHCDELGIKYGVQARKTNLAAQLEVQGLAEDRFLDLLSGKRCQ